MPHPLLLPSTFCITFIDAVFAWRRYRFLVATLGSDGCPPSPQAGQRLQNPAQALLLLFFLYSTTVNYNPRNKLTTTTVQTYTSHTHIELGSLDQAFNLRPWGPPAYIRLVVPRPYPPPSVGLPAGRVSPPTTCPAPSAASFAVLWSSYLASSFLLPAPWWPCPNTHPHLSHPVNGLVLVNQVSGWLPPTQTQQPYHSPYLWRALDVASPLAPPQELLVGRAYLVPLAPVAPAACPPVSSPGTCKRLPICVGQVATSKGQSCGPYLSHVAS